jgi:hypothetical protein
MYLPCGNLAFLAFAVLNHLIFVNCYLTHESIRNLTSITDDARGRILEAEQGVERVVQVLGGGQGVLMSGDGEGEEIELVCLSSPSLISLIWDDCDEISYSV